MNGTVLFLIPCSRRKRKKTKKDLILPIRTVFDLLSPSAAHKLRISRSSLLYKIKNNEIEPASFDSASILMPAYLRYAGTFYEHLSAVWKRLETNPRAFVLIISALYGILDFREEIHQYDVKMEHTGTFWMENDISLILSDLARRNSISQIYDLLPENYAAPLGLDSIGVNTTRIEVISKDKKVSEKATLACKAKWLHDMVLMGKFSQTVNDYEIITK